MSRGSKKIYVPDTLQVHRTDFDDVSCLFALENAVSATSSHASHIEQLCAVDHVIVCEKKAESVGVRNARWGDF